MFVGVIAWKSAMCANVTSSHFQLPHNRHTDLKMLKVTRMHLTALCVCVCVIVFELTVGADWHLYCWLPGNLISTPLKIPLPASQWGPVTSHPIAMDEHCYCGQWPKYPSFLRMTSFLSFLNTLCSFFYLWGSKQLHSFISTFLHLKNEMKLIYLFIYSAISGLSSKFSSGSVWVHKTHSRSAFAVCFHTSLFFFMSH